MISEEQSVTENHPYYKGFETGYFEGLSAENPYIYDSESYRYFQSGQEAGSRAWNKKHGGITNSKE